MEEHLIDTQMTPQLGSKKGTPTDAVCIHLNEVQDAGNEHVEDLVNQSETVITEEGILNSQESIISEKEKEGHEALITTQDSLKTGGEKRSIPIKPPEIRRSDRLKQNITITTKEKNEIMPRKRNLEGNSNASHVL